MIITDLLGTNVILNDEAGKIRAVYGDGTNIRFCILLESGKFSFGVSPHDVVLNEKRIYAVYMGWKPEQKIRAIKAYRMVQEVDLKRAKDIVESQLYSTLLKDNMTYDEATALVETIKVTDPLEYVVRKMASRC